MKKSTKYAKKLLALFLVVLMSIDGFAAVVGDNDGSAFVTKAEFEALKNDFNKQIEIYNDSIDSKIDGAVASYLAGIQKSKKEMLKNIYEELGGKNIKFGSPNIGPTIKPVTGWALFFENGDRFGVSVGSLGAGNWGIKDPYHAFWTERSGQVEGNVLIYKEEIGRTNRFIDCCRATVVQAVYAGGWWTGATDEVRKSRVDYPFGSTGADLNAPITGQSRSFVDFQQAVLRECKRIENRIDTWTAAWDMDTANDKVFISEENYKHVNTLQANLGSKTIEDQPYIYNGKTPTAGGNIHDTDDCTWTNVLIFNWDIDENQSYISLTPGFYWRTNYENTIYGGVQFFESESTGKVKIKNMKFTRVPTGTVYFAINSTPFANQELLRGDVKMSNVTGAVIDNESLNRYRVNAGIDVTLEFDIEKNKTYYIKCQPATTKSKSNTVYCGIANGTTIEAEYE